MRSILLFGTLLLAVFGSSAGGQTQQTPASEIAPTGRLRVGFQTASPILAKRAPDGSVSGVVVDGASRDIDEARDLEFPVYARSVVPMTARGRVMQESYNQEIQFAGVQCHPGDLVLADGSGVIIIAKEKENEVVAAAEAIYAKEQEMAAGIRKGYSGLEMLEKLGYEQMLSKK